MTDYARIQQMTRQRMNYVGATLVTIAATFLAITDHGRWFVIGVLTVLSIIWVFVVGELSRDIQLAKQKEENAFRARTQTQRD